jgi:hypothetical protein
MISVLKVAAGIIGVPGDEVELFGGEGVCSTSADMGNIARRRQ